MNWRLKKIGFGIVSRDPDEIMRNATAWVECLRKLRSFMRRNPEDFEVTERRNVMKLLDLCDKEGKYIKVAMEEYDVIPAEQERIITLFQHYLPEMEVKPRVIQLGVPEL
jgi:hypothetical protein